MAKKPEKRGIRIALTEKSWELICETLEFTMGDRPLSEGFSKKSREKMGKVLQYIQRKLKEQNQEVHCDQGQTVGGKDQEVPSL